MTPVTNESSPRRVGLRMPPRIIIIYLFIYLSPYLSIYLSTGAYTGVRQRRECRREWSQSKKWKLSLQCSGGRRGAAKPCDGGTTIPAPPRPSTQIESKPGEPERRMKWGNATGAYKYLPTYAQAFGTTEFVTTCSSRGEFLSDTSMNRSGSLLKF